MISRKNALIILVYLQLWFLFSVNFSEPLSMLQRISEDLEYADILSKAANCTDHCEQLAYVAAFTVSAFR